MTSEIARREAELDDLVAQSLAAIKAAERQFGLPPLESEMDAASKEAERLQQRRDRTATQVDELTEQIDAIERREGGFYTQAVERYAGVLGNVGDRILQAEAAATTTLEDDDLVAEIRVLRERFVEQSRTAKQAEQSAKVAQSRADDLLYVVRRAGQSNLTSGRASFPTTFDLDELLRQHEKGVIDRGRFLEIVKETAHLEPTLAEKAYNRGAETLNSPTAQILIGTAAQAALPALQKALERRR